MSPAPALAQNVPLATLDNWMWYNESGWENLDRAVRQGRTNFRKAIQVLEPYSPANRKLMAQTYCDLARVLYYQKRTPMPNRLRNGRFRCATPTRKPAPTLYFSACLRWRRSRPPRSILPTPSPTSGDR